MRPDFLRSDTVPVLWRVRPGLTSYPEAMEEMHHYVDAIRAGTAREAIWLLESPSAYNAGSTSKPEDLISTAKVPIEKVEGPMRPGSYTYHGPGIRVIVVMLDLNQRRKDTAGFVRTLEQWIINSLSALGIVASRAENDPAGVWVGSEKVAAMALRLTGNVSSYGLLLYLDPDITHFDGIKLCGIACRVTSVARQGKRVTMAELDVILREQFERLFGPTSLVAEERIAK